MNFIKGRWFPMAVVSALVVLVAIVMASFGWRITYEPELENSWDAITATATWVSVITSFFAIVFAIWVPFVIAKRQDKIALFEKRFECYMAIQRLLSFATSIQKIETSEDICKTFIISMGYQFRNFGNADISDIIGYFQTLETSIVAGHFLFESFYLKELQELIKSTTDLVVPLAKKYKSGITAPLSAQQKTTRDKLFSLGKDFKGQHMKELEHEMKNY